MPQSRQPYLHDLITVLAAPTQALSAASGDVCSPVAAANAHGVMHADVRVLSRAELRVDGFTVVPLAAEVTGGAAIFTSLLQEDTGPGRPDPQLRLDRRRTVTPGRVTETLTVSALTPDPVRARVGIEFGTDLAPMESIKVGGPRAPRPFPAVTGDRVRWRAGEVESELVAPGARLRLTDDEETLSCAWPVDLPAGGAVELSWSVEVTDAGAVVIAPDRPARPRAERAAPLLAAVAGRSAVDSRLRPWLEQSLSDLDGLRMALPAAPGDVFYAAGAPWYLTLFGRDSLWAARMMLPLDLAPAAGTLRALARLQGRRSDRDAAEQPGKIMHELRRHEYVFGDVALPPLYFGTIDATPLWVCLLHDTWRAGLPEAEVVELLPALERALGWLTTYADADGDGFCEYLDVTGHGLANQGWKDSGDSVRFADGRRAEGSVALCEVQGYAYEAAMAGATVADAFGLAGGGRYRAWAAALADRFRAAFWCGTGPGRYPALALDGRKQRVDALTSNIGHLLGTGLLDAEEEGVVARHVTGAELDSGLGLRTMSDRDAGYSPLSYHCGSVWPHDTAIVIEGLRRAGRADEAAGLREGLLRAAAAFDYRLPELWSGEGRPVPYPAACRPQAWSAAAAVVVAHGLGVPAGAAVSGRG